MAVPQDERIANHLEKLPLELHEPILSHLSLRDIIAVAQYAPEGGRLESALAISPAWGEVWPAYLAHKHDLQTLVSLMMPVGGRLYDPTERALNLTAGQFTRRIARRSRMADGLEYDFFNETILRTSRNIQRQLFNMSKVTLAYICDNIPFDSIGVICPWLITQPPTITDSDERTIEQIIRDEFLKTLQTPCRCAVLYGQRLSIHPQAATSMLQSPNYDSFLCQIKHPGSLTPDWSVPQMKAFVDGYTRVQKDLNTRKAQQLRDLADMYRTHPDRLKTPLAPQSPRKNPAHIPLQLDVVAGHVLRIIDIDRTLQRRSRQGISRFRYPHACLVPYDWCLELWLDVIRKHQPLLVASLAGSGDNDKSLEESMIKMTIGDNNSSIPEGIANLLPIAHEGLRHFFSDRKHDSLPPEDSKVDEPRAAAARLPRVSFNPDERSPNHARFLIHETEAMAVGGCKDEYMPPVNPAEVEWLDAFVRCIEWMEEEFPDLARQAKENGEKRLCEGIKSEQDLTSQDVTGETEAKIGK